ncbi:flippase [Robinsoniella peoriensis]|uniref:flippase n=1 Tax=Robinsoniella peoriensis TaxID=180332 RepID=UPI0005C7BD05|nr:flippase [Robinsoniella peoriensis]
MKTKSITVNTALNTVRMSLTILIPLITYPYITRIFGAEGIGQYEWVKSVVSIFTLIASMGITTYAIREGSKIRDNRKKFSQFAQELLILNMCSTIICYIILLALILSVPKFSMYKLYLVIYSVNIGLSALSLDWVYGVYEDYLYITARQIIVQIISVCGLFLFVRDENDLVVYIVITTISNSGANIFNFLRSRMYIDFKVLKHYNLAIHLAPVIVFFGTRFAMNAYNSLDTFILGMLTTDRAVGYYNVAVKMNTILVTFFSAMSPVYLPRMMKYVSTHDQLHYDNLLEKAIKLKAILIYPMIGGLFFFAPQIVWVIAGEEFSNAVLTLRILCFVLGFVILSSIVQKDIMIPKGKEKSVLVLTVFAAFVNVILSIVLIMNLDYNGAAWGSLIAECLTFLIGAFLVKRSGINLFRIIPRCSYKYFISTLIMSIACYMATQVLEKDELIILVGIPIAVIIYFASLIILKDSFLISTIKMILSKLHIIQ